MAVTGFFFLFVVYSGRILVFLIFFPVVPSITVPYL
ncbi:MAG TPA: hypothetical protein DEB17_06155 [Chlorobaculum sp.]|uniref:Uncharacterized protein n=1 Tax=Chlorobaculum tepidum (strain ATCC 49652 / DSM 12025 / NBRC 103806 / TLS) TaxID=194439 RepID=Q8KD03_CHLTE|nr:hypothetical protein CT1254 [Chlorobaculum tepidum TLS]HBU23565.1 hypothetical protein [Chlorobaculum sp.]